MDMEKKLLADGGVLSDEGSGMRLISPSDPRARGPDARELEDVLGFVGVGPMQYRMLALCGLMWGIAAMDAISTSFLLAELPKHFEGVDDVRAAALVSVYTIMWLLGGGFGRVADVCGRKVALAGIIMLQSFSVCAMASAQSLLMVIFFKGLAGAAVGGAIPVSFSLSMEFVTASVRAKFSSLVMSIWMLGELAACGLAATVMARYGWRVFLLSYGVPTLLLLIILLVVPESPRLLMVQGRDEETLRALDWVARANGKRLPDHWLLVKASEEKVESRVGDLFKEGMAATTIKLWLLWSFANVPYYGFYFFYPQYLLHLTDDAQADSQKDIYINTALGVVGQLPAFAVGYFLMDRLGRARMMLWGNVGCVLTYGTCAVILWLGLSPWALAGTAMAVRFSQTLDYVARYTFTTEIYPTQIRATGIASATTFKQISIICVPTISVALMRISMEASLWCWTACSVVCVGLALSLMKPVPTAKAVKLATLDAAAPPTKPAPPPTKPAPRRLGTGPGEYATQEQLDAAKSAIGDALI